MQSAIPTVRLCLLLSWAARVRTTAPPGELMGLARLPCATPSSLGTSRPSDHETK
jgi:hypothetical protein